MRILAASMAIVAAVTAPALAQEDPETPASPPPLENTYGQDTPEEANAAINAQQAEAARQQLDQNAASRRAYEEALVAREQKIREEQEAYEAEAAKRAREYEEAMAKWRADVAACEAGDLTRCAPVETSAEE